MADGFSSPVQNWGVRSLRGLRLSIARWLGDHDWQIVAALWTVSFALGYIGFVSYSARHNLNNSVLDNLYLTIQLFAMESGSVQGIHNWSLGIARFLAPVATLYTAITALAVLFRDELQLFKIRFISDHVVICGLGRQGFILANRFLDRGDRVVVIDRDPANERIGQCRDAGGIAIVGNAYDDEVLLKAGVERARCLISVCGEDGVNAEVAVDARAMVADRRREPLTCVVKIDDLELCHLLRGHELGMGDAGSFRLELFNSYLRGARAILEKHPPFDRSFGTNPHLVVVGVGRMGESLVVQAAMMWRRRDPEIGHRLRVTLIDRSAREKKKLLVLKNPLLEQVCELDTRDMDVRSAEFVAGDFLFDAEGRCVVTRVYVLLDDDARALSAAMTLLKRLRGQDVPVIVRMSREGGLEALLHGIDASREGFGSLCAFGLLEKTCDPDLVLNGAHEVLARAIFAEYALSAIVPGDPQKPVSAWDSLSPEYKDAFRRQTDCIGAALRNVGCTVEPLTHLNTQSFHFLPGEVDVMARSIYDFHQQEPHTGRVLLATVFRVPVEMHPNVQKWDDSAEYLKEAYRDFVRSLPEVLAKVDFQIYRLR